MEDNYKYHVFIHDAAGIAELEAYGFLASSVSTDGNLCIVNKHDNIARTITNIPVKPSYVTEPFLNWPYLSHPEARQLRSYHATTNGGSDGYVYSIKGV